MAFPNTFYLVRHGESTFNRDGIIQGQSNESVLTTIGKEQAAGIGSSLHGIDIKYCICSPLTRAQQTAAIINQSLVLPETQITMDERLVEIDFKSWAGCAKEKIKKDFPEKYAQWRNRPFDFCLDDKFPIQELYDRLNRLTGEFDNPNSQMGKVLIVGHRGSITGLIVNLLRLSISGHHCIQINAGSITVIAEKHRSKREIIYELKCLNVSPPTYRMGSFA